MYTKDDIKRLHQETGMGIINCKIAFKYANEHDGVTPLGYLKAISYAVNTPRLTFLERCLKFSSQ